MEEKLVLGHTQTPQRVTPITVQLMGDIQISPIGLSVLNLAEVGTNSELELAQIPNLNTVERIVRNLEHQKNGGNVRHNRAPVTLNLGRGQHVLRLVQEVCKREPGPAMLQDGPVE